MPLIQCHVARSDSSGRQMFSYSFKVNKFAIGGSCLRLLSASAPGQAIRFLAAALRVKDYPGPSVRFEGECEGSVNDYFGVVGKWDVRYAKLSYDDWQLLALRRDSNDDTRKAFFLPNVTDAALWRILSSSEFTTPMLKGWVPWLRQQMADSGALKPCEAYLGCKPNMLYLDDTKLDSLVSAGVQSGYLKMERDHAS